MKIAELGTLLIQIAHSHFALEQTLISLAKKQFNQMSKESRVNWQNPILSGLLMSDKREKSGSKQEVSSKIEPSK